MIRNLAKSVFSTNKTLTVCVVMCVFLSIFLFLYEYSFMNKIAHINGDNLYSVSTEGKTYSDVSDKVGAVSDDFYDIIYITANGIVVTADFSGYTAYNGRMPIAAEEALSNSNEIPVGSKIQYGDTEYTVVGNGNFDFGEVMISSDGVDDNEQIAGVAMRSYRFGVKKPLAVLRSVFSGADVTVPQNVSALELFKNQPIFILLIIMLLSEIAVFSFCLIYLFNRSRKTIEVYRFLGFGNKNIIANVAACLLIALSAIFVICAAVYAVAEAVGAKVLLDSFVYRLTISDYLISFAVFIVLCLPMIASIVYLLIGRKVRYKDV